MKNSLYGSSNDLDWLYHKLDSVTTEQYLSIGVNRKLQKLTPYWLGDIIWFSGDSWNGDLFTTNGISGNEDNFTWTDGHDVQFLFAIKILIIQKIILSQFPLQEYSIIHRESMFGKIRV